VSTVDKGERVNVYRLFKKRWPGWLKVVFTISALLFIATLSLVISDRYTLSAEPASELDVFVKYTSAITGLITALSGVYGQIHSVRKEKAELELEKRKLELEYQKNTPKKNRKPPARKTKPSK